MTQVKQFDMSFPSHDGIHDIHGIIWQPLVEQPLGIVQIVHGMSEHIERYEPFALFLAKQGYVVCGHDHIGHGHSVHSSADLGHLSPRNGAEVLVEDVNTLRTLVSSAFSPDIPYIIFGHSMGSYTLRVYLTRYGAGLSGAILCGTGQKPRIVSWAGNVLARFLAKVKGERATSPFIHSMADGAFAKAIKNPRTEFDWISADEGNVDRYIADELNGFPFTLGGYAALTRLTALAASLEQAKKIPSDLPLLFIAGAEDPVGDNGKGVQAAAEMVRQAGAQEVEVVLFDGMRHEILNEADAQLVFDTVLTWIEAHTL